MICLSMCQHRCTYIHWKAPLTVHGILVEHEGLASLDLSFENLSRVLKLLGFDRLPTTALLLVALEEFLKLLTLDVRETRNLIKVEERPSPSVSARFIEEISSADFLLPVIHADVGDVGVPARALVASKINVAGGCIICAKHGHDIVRETVRARDIRAA